MSRGVVLAAVEGGCRSGGDGGYTWCHIFTFATLEVGAGSCTAEAM